MLKRRLGRTGHDSTVAILGGAAFGRTTPEEAVGPFEDAIRRGVNHIDVAPRYGAAEDVLGPLIEPLRDDLFLACKTTRRNADGVRAQLEESLTKLRTDRFDLYQLHAVTDLAVLDERADAAEAILKMRDEGLVRYVGITGHNVGAPGAHLEAVRRWDLDTVMFPVNARMWSDADYRREAEALLEHCVGRDVGVMAIKAVARKPWDEGDRFATTWYEPWTQGPEIQRGVDFALSVPGVHAICTPGDVDILRLTLDAVEGLSELDEPSRETAIADARDLASIFPIPA